MSKLILVTGNDPDALLRAAAAPFCSTRPHDLPLLALRQGGLRDVVNEMAAASGSPGWLGRPVVVFNELPALFAPERAPLDGFEREALLMRLLADTPLHALGFRRARRTLAAALDRLFGDLLAEGVTAPDVERALANLDADAWGRKRSADVATLFSAYLHALDELPPRNGVRRTDGRDGLLAAARVMASAASGQIVGLRRPFETWASSRSVDIYGLADLRRGWRHFLDALVASRGVDELRLYVTDGQSLEVRLWAEARGATARTVPTARVTAPAVTVTAAPDLGRELEDVARSIKQLLVEGDAKGNAVLARDVAVVARQSRPYLTRAAEVFARYGIPTYARLRHTLSEVPAIAAIARVFQGAADDWNARRLRELSDSPYFAIQFDVSLLREAGAGAGSGVHPRGLDAWTEALATLRAGCDGDDDAERADRRRARIDAATTEFTRFADAVRPLSATRPIADWLDVTIAMLGGVAGDSAGLLTYATRVCEAFAPTAPAVLRDASRIDAVALRAVVDLLASWREAAKLAPSRDPIDAAQWLLELERALSEQEVSVRTGERGGVQLIEATAAEGQSWTHVFVVGMSAGSFPLEPSKDVLLGDADRQRLSDAGLPVEPASVWRRREQALWGSLANAPSASLRLSYAYADGTGTAQLPSAFLDEVISRLGDDGEGVNTIPGSRVVPSPSETVWSTDEALRLGASATRDAACGGLAKTMLAAATDADASAADVLQLLHVAMVERERQAGRTLASGATAGRERGALAHPWNGRVDDPALLAHLRKEFGDRVWSATQLETYGRCGFSFLGKYVLRVNEVEEDEDEVSARDAGTIMHEALAATYRRLIARDAEHPLSARNVDVARAVVAEEVASAFEAMGVKGGAGVHAARVRETTILLQEYVAWEIDKNDGSAARRPTHMELGFGLNDGGAPAVKLEDGPRTLRLRGRIDRVDELIPEVAEGYRYIVDHKSGAGAFTGVGALQEAGAVIQLALYLAALDQVVPGAKVWGGAYQLIRGLERKAPLDRCSLARGVVTEAQGVKAKAADERIRGAAGLALSLVDGVLAGRFAARVPDGTSCLAYCQFRDVCREQRMAR